MNPFYIRTSLERVTQVHPGIDVEVQVPVLTVHHLPTGIKVSEEAQPTETILEVKQRAMAKLQRKFQ